MSKNPEVVIAIASKVKGSIFAKSFERSSLTWAVIRTDATNAAEINKIVPIASSFDSNNNKMDKMENQKNVRIGSMMIYSIT